MSEPSDNDRALRRWFLLFVYQNMIKQQEQYAHLAEMASNVRAQTIRELHDELGMSYGELGRATGLTRARIQQLTEKGRKLRAGEAVATQGTPPVD